MLAYIVQCKLNKLNEKFNIRKQCSGGTGMKTKNLLMNISASDLRVLLTVSSCTTFFSYAEDNQKDANAPQYTIGVGVASVPEFSGASENETRFLPLISIRYGRLSIGGVNGIAYELLNNNDLTVNATAGYFRGRDESDAEYLNGLGSIESSVTAGVAINKSIGPWRVGLKINRDFSEDVGGVTAGLSGSYSHKFSQQILVTLSSSVTWMDSNYASGVYGITEDQEMASVLKAYAASSGIESIGLSLSGLYFIDQHWTLTAVVSQSQLACEAKLSPITRKSNPHFIMTGISYRF